MPNSICTHVHFLSFSSPCQGYFRLQGNVNAYVCSLSSKTIVYKGMLRACDLPLFYKDLRDPNYKTSFAVYHRRFSTNTVPKWFLAQVCFTSCTYNCTPWSLCVMLCTSSVYSYLHSSAAESPSHVIDC